MGLEVPLGLEMADWADWAGALLESVRDTGLAPSEDLVSFLDEGAISRSSKILSSSEERNPLPKELFCLGVLSPVDGVAFGSFEELIAGHLLFRSR